MTTYNSSGTYSLVKNPGSGYPQIIVSSAPFISSAAKFGPAFLVGFSSSQGANPPVYIDDITVKSLSSVPIPPLPNPYTIQSVGNRFTNMTVLKLGGPIGGATVDPSDNTTIVFMTDAVSGGGIYQAKKVAPGNWAADPTRRRPRSSAAWFIHRG